MNKKLYRQFAIIITTLLVPVVPFAIIGELPGDRWLDAAGRDAWLFAATGAGLLSLDILLPLPSSIVGTLLGARLGLLPGFAATFLGLLAGHCIGWALGRLALARLSAELPETPTALVVFLSRPVPVLAEAAAIAAGAGRMGFLRFVAAAAAGDAIYAAVLAGNGAALLPDSLLGLGLVVPMLLPVLAWGVWRWLAPQTRRA